jgi:hypothetical protein
VTFFQREHFDRFVVPHDRSAGSVVLSIFRVAKVPQFLIELGPRLPTCLISGAFAPIFCVSFQLEQHALAEGVDAERVVGGLREVECAL